jgi:hypothetical protein
VFGIIAWSGVAVFDRRRRTVTLKYDLDEAQTRKFAELVAAFKQLAKCQRVWRVPVQVQELDWKRHAGAAYTIERSPLSLTVEIPVLIESNIAFPTP